MEQHVNNVKRDSGIYGLSLLTISKYLLIAEKDPLTAIVLGAVVVLYAVPIFIFITFVAISFIIFFIGFLIIEGFVFFVALLIISFVLSVITGLIILVSLICATMYFTVRQLYTEHSKQL